MSRVFLVWWVATPPLSLHLLFLYGAHRFSIHFKCYITYTLNIILCLNVLEHIERFLVKFAAAACCFLLTSQTICNFYLIVTLFAHDSLCLMFILLFWLWLGLLLLLLLLLMMLLLMRISKHIICRCCQLKLSQLFISTCIYISLLLFFLLLKWNSSIHMVCSVHIRLKFVAFVENNGKSTRNFIRCRKKVKKNKKQKEQHIWLILKATDKKRQIRILRYQWEMRSNEKENWHQQQKQWRWRRQRPKIANNLITNQQCIIKMDVRQSTSLHTHTHSHRWTISIMDVAYGIDISKHPHKRRKREGRRKKFMRITSISIGFVYLFYTHI